MEGIIATNKGGTDFEIPEAGSYIAKCWKIIDIGTQTEQFQGKPIPAKRKILVYFELLEDEEGKPYRMDNGEPFSIMQKYTLSTNPKANLRKHIDAWRGKPLTEKEAESFNVVNLLGKSCRLQVSLDDKGDRTWVNVASIGYTKKDPDGVNPTFWWSITEPDMNAYEKFPDWLRSKITAAQERDIIQAAQERDIIQAAQERDIIQNGPAQGPIVAKDGKSHIDPQSGDVVPDEIDDGVIDLSDVVEKF